MDTANKAGPPPPGTNSTPGANRSPGARTRPVETAAPTAATQTTHSKPAAEPKTEQWKLREVPVEPPPSPKEIPVPSDVTPQKASGSETPQVMMIRHMALEMSRQPKALSKEKPTQFLQRLENCYLYELLKSTAALGSDERKRLGAEAVKKIGAPFEGDPNLKDSWERGAAFAWKKKEIPAGAKTLLPGIPDEIEGATHVLSGDNRSALPILDGPFLLGKPNYAVDDDVADVFHGGQNISHLLHWATGVKYAHVEPSKLRALFLMYELWHLEGWDVFGEDPINDLISEEQGRLLGRLLLDGQINKDNLREKLDETFLDARAWVGQVLAERQDEFDHFLNSPLQPQSNMWWGKMKALTVWQSPTLKALAAAGKTEEEIKQSDFAQRIAAIYSLIYEGKDRARLFGGLSSLEADLAAGELNEMFWKVHRNRPFSNGEKMKAMWSLRPSVLSAL